MHKNLIHWKRIHIFANQLKINQLKNTSTMKLINRVKIGRISKIEDCNLAILNNFDKNSVAYKNAYNAIKLVLIDEFEETEYQFDEIDIKIEILQILEIYNQ